MRISGCFLLRPNTAQALACFDDGKFCRGIQQGECIRSGLAGAALLVTVLCCFRWNNGHGLPTRCNGLFFNPKGIASFSPALARCREGLRRVASRKRKTLKGFHINDLRRRYNPFRVCDFFVLSPWVAPSPAFAALRRGKSQPRADRFNPFGIA